MQSAAVLAFCIDVRLLEQGRHKHMTGVTIAQLDGKPGAAAEARAHLPLTIAGQSACQLYALYLEHGVI